MKILTILGTRPEIIRLSRVISKLDSLVDHKILHTGQNFDTNLNDIFFTQLGIRNPDYTITSKDDNLSGQIAKIFIGVEEVLNTFKPDKILVLGDTNSGLCSIICERLGYPVYHMEAGNRCYDLRVPEEKNRKIIDAVSTYNLPYSNLSRENLLREGISNNKIFVTGNPIREVLLHYGDLINNSSILERLELTSGEYIIVTAHRAENVDVPSRLKNIFSALHEMGRDYKVVFSCHPRTAEKMRVSGITDTHPNILICNPFGFFDFVKLEKNSRLAVTDSGTVQEEMCLMGVPTITIRDTTERPETVWCGSNIVCGLDVDSIMGAYRRITSRCMSWNPPPEYLKMDVSDTVVNILLSNDAKEI